MALQDESLNLSKCDKCKEIMSLHLEIGFRLFYSGIKYYDTNITRFQRNLFCLFMTTFDCCLSLKSASHPILVMDMQSA